MNLKLWSNGVLVALACTSGFVVATNAQPVLIFTSPIDGQQVVSLAGLSGAVTDTGTVQVTFSIFNQTTGQWWDGTN